jgi:2-keto-4-pentenoate hydratase/2-oxohepta-3-ene-1,7-dioic acid hydratase in catechol pathway
MNASINASRRSFLLTMTAGLAAWRCSQSVEDDGITRYVRYEHSGSVAHGILRGDSIQPIEGDLFGSRTPSGNPIPAADARLLYPTEPRKILALAGNYGSHIGDQPPPGHPEPFFKPITCLQHPEGDIILPPGAQDVHYEAELVVVISRRATNVTPEQAAGYILGYTCGNDVSERNWQNGSIDGPENQDMQWWRAKGSETFGPVGPCVAVGWSLENAMIRSRLNGDVRQEAPLTDLIHKPAETVSFISRYVTLEPGDLIFTGTPGTTSRMNAGDVIEIEVDGIGVLRNRVA